MWVPSDPGPDFVQDDPLFGALQFTLNEVQSVLLELDVSKGGIPPCILKNRTSAFARLHVLFFLIDLYRMCFSRQVKIFLRYTDIH
jgi:hypothetical protein